MPYRLNGNDTRKLANSDTRESVEKHRYPPHYYMCGNGDVYMINQLGQLFFVGFDSEAAKCVWCPHGGFEILPWVPIVQSGGLCVGALSPVTYTDLIIMTGVRSCIYVRRGVILYEGYYDGRGLLAKKQPRSSEDDPVSIGTQEIPAWLKDENGKYTAQDSKVEKWISYTKVYEKNRPDQQQVIRKNCLSDDQVSRYGTDAKSWDGLVPQYENVIAGTSDYTVQSVGHLAWQCVRTSPLSANCQRIPEIPESDTDNVSWNVTRIWGVREPDYLCDGNLDEGLLPAQGYSWKPCWTYSPCTLIAKQESIPTGAYFYDIGGGFAMFPYTWTALGKKDHTWLGEVGSAGALPGHAGTKEDYILTDWDACRNYEIKQSLDCAEQEGIVRTGLQEGDCFFNAASDKFWRLEFNGWKEYSDYDTVRYGAGCGGKYVVILPTMLTEKSAHNTDDCEPCKPKWLVTGAAWEYCDLGYCLIKDAAHQDVDKHRWYFFNKEKQLAEGTGNAELFCLGKFAVLKFSKGDPKQYTYRIYCQGHDQSIGTISTPTNLVPDTPSVGNLAEYRNLVFIYGDEKTPWKVSVFCCPDSGDSGHVGTWRYPEGPDLNDDQYVYGRNEHSARMYLDGRGTYGVTYVPLIVIDENGNYQGRWQVISDCTALEMDDLCEGNFGDMYDPKDQYLVKISVESASGSSSAPGSDSNSEPLPYSPDVIYANIDCKPSETYDVKGPWGTNYENGISKNGVGIHSVHGLYGVAGWAMGYEPLLSADPVYGDFTISGTCYATTLSIKLELDSTSSTDYVLDPKKLMRAKGIDADSKKVVNADLILVMCNHYTLSQYIYNYVCRNPGYTFGDFDTNSVETAFSGGPMPITTTVYAILRLKVMDKNESENSTNFEIKKYTVFSGSLSGFASADPQTTVSGSTRHKELLRPAAFVQCGASESDQTTRYFFAKHKKGYTSAAALSVIVVSSGTTLPDGKAIKGESLVFEIGIDGNAREGSSLPAFMCVAKSNEQALTYMSSLHCGEWIEAGHDEQTYASVPGGAYATGYTLTYGGAIYGGNVAYRCACPGCDADLACRYGTFTAASSKSSLPSKYIHFNGWEKEFPELTAEVWAFGGQPLQDVGIGRWNDLWCCKNMVALLVITDVDENANLPSETYADEYLCIYAVTVKLWIYIMSDENEDGTFQQKEVVEKIYSGKTYAYHYWNAEEGHSYWIDAGAEVSCGCGLNIYWAWIGEQNWHEVYEGITKKDYKWATCCGDNHLLAGTSDQGWEPVINIAVPIEESTCILDDGTECIVSKSEAVYMYSQTNSDPYEAMMDLAEFVTAGLQNGTLTYDQYLTIMLYAHSGGLSMANVEMFLDGTISAEDLQGSAEGTVNLPANLIAGYRIVEWEFVDSSGNKRIFSHDQYIPLKYEKNSGYTVYARTRTDVNKSIDPLAEDDTLYDVTCWAHKYGGEVVSAISVKGVGNNSRDGAFITFGAQGALHERVISVNEDAETGIVTIIATANEVKDNHKFYTGHRLLGSIHRIQRPEEAYRFKALERNHKRQGVYAKMAGETRTENPDFDANGNIKAGVQLDFDHVKNGKHPDANKRLFVDDKESWYRYDRLPEVSTVDEEPVGIHWNHPDAALHRTTVWSGNGLLYIEHV